MLLKQCHGLKGLSIFGALDRGLFLLKISSIFFYFIQISFLLHRDFAKTELPAIAKIVKGQQHNLGVPTLSNPSLQSTALFLSAGKKYQILAQPIKIKDGRKSTNVGELFSQQKQKARGNLRN
jgi:hypothetical protein